MSWDGTTYVRYLQRHHPEGRRLKPGPRLVLIEVGNQFNDHDKTCSVSRVDLQEVTGLAPGSIARIVSVLEQRGLVRRVTKPGLSMVLELPGFVEWRDAMHSRRRGRLPANAGQPDAAGDDNPPQNVTGDPSQNVTGTRDELERDPSQNEMGAAASGDGYPSRDAAAYRKESEKRNEEYGGGGARPRTPTHTPAHEAPTDEAPSAPPPPPLLLRFDEILRSAPGYDPDADFYADVAALAPFVDLEHEARKIVKYVGPKGRKPGGPANTLFIDDWLKRARRGQVDRPAPATKTAPPPTRSADSGAPPPTPALPPLARLADLPPWQQLVVQLSGITDAVFESFIAPLAEPIAGTNGARRLVCPSPFHASQVARVLEHIEHALGYEIAIEVSAPPTNGHNGRDRTAQHQARQLERRGPVPINDAVQQAARELFTPEQLADRFGIETPDAAGDSGGDSA